MARTQQERKADTRARLLDAAASLFAERGVDAVSVDSVAEAAGRTSGAVYAHFGSKQGLLLALLDEWSHSLVTVITAEFELSSDVERRLRAVATNVVTSPTDQTSRLLLLERELWLRAARDPEIALAMQARARRAHDRLTRGFARWIEQGIIEASAPPDVLATVFQAVIVGLEMQRRIDPDSLPLEDAVAALSTVLATAKTGLATPETGLATPETVLAAPTKEMARAH